MLDNDLAALIGFGCEALMYGIYVVIFVLSLVFLYSGRRTQTNRLMTLSISILFILCTAHFALEFNHFYRTLERTGVAGYATETKELFAADILISLIDFVGDVVLLHRCWLVWGKNYHVVILPLLTAAAGFACGMSGLGILLNIDPTAPQAPLAVRPLGTAAFTLPLATNFLITILTVVRLYSMASKSRAANNGNPVTTTSHVKKAVAIVVESGLLYLIGQLVFVILFSIGHPAQGIVAVIVVQIYGIAPTLISFRVGLGIATEEYELSTKQRSAAEWRLSTRRTVPTNHTEVSIHTTREVVGDSTSDFALYPGVKDLKDYRLGNHRDLRDTKIAEDDVGSAV
ncbi:hypothetical protein BXZ70DRAFT_538501 [Cristinia sonorae]|uniref:Uncharacterized protein n=1 Tax=Cristinia sonorae TaxID=1940300 RepID=A0A8K0UHC2_9AGAR|nr:hypothetical protein BXZ70DRAFT_538501 [Cristinia sonorae]